MRTTISVLVAILIVLSSSANSNEPNRLPNVTSVLVEKAKRNMYLMAGRRIIKSYRIALGKNPVGPKQFEGDGKTPEGRYKKSTERVLSGTACVLPLTV